MFDSETGILVHVKEPEALAGRYAMIVFADENGSVTS